MKAKASGLKAYIQEKKISKPILSKQNHRITKKKSSSLKALDFIINGKIESTANVKSQQRKRNKIRQKHKFIISMKYNNKSTLIFLRFVMASQKKNKKTEKATIKPKKALSRT